MYKRVLVTQESSVGYLLWITTHYTSVGYLLLHFCSHYIPALLLRFQLTHIHLSSGLNASFLCEISLRALISPINSCTKPLNITDYVADCNVVELIFSPKILTPNQLWKAFIPSSLSLLSSFFLFSLLPCLSFKINLKTAQSCLLCPMSIQHLCYCSVIELCLNLATSMGLQYTRLPCLHFISCSFQTHVH